MNSGQAEKNAAAKDGTPVKHQALILPSLRAAGRTGGGGAGRPRPGEDHWEDTRVEGLLSPRGEARSLHMPYRQVSLLPVTQHGTSGRENVAQSHYPHQQWHPPSPTSGLQIPPHHTTQGATITDADVGVKTNCGL